MCMLLLRIVVRIPKGPDILRRTSYVDQSTGFATWDDEFLCRRHIKYNYNLTLNYIFIMKDRHRIKQSVSQENRAEYDKNALV